MLNFFGFNKPTIIDKATLIQILDETISPSLEKNGLVRTGNYQWHETTLKQIRCGFSYMHLKGAAGTFSWGVNLDFVPLVINSKIVYHKSAKNYLHHLFEWPDEYANSFYGGELNGGVTTHFGAKKAKHSILRLFDQYEEKIMAWYNRNSTLEALIQTAEQQLVEGKHYKHHTPGANYTLAFLYAKTKRLDRAIELFDRLPATKFDNNLELKEKVRKKNFYLQQIANKR